MNILYLLSGYRVLEADGKYGVRLLELCRENCFAFIDCTGAPDGSVRITCRPRTAKKLLKACELHKIEAFCVKSGGLLPWIAPIFKRYGVLAGIFTAALLIYCSGRVLWDVRINGNSQFAYSELIEILSDNGLSVGSYIPGIDVANTEKAVLLGSDGKISWVSINIRGTVAEVEIMERTEPKESRTGYANVVAKSSGVVEYMEVFDGSPTVRTGDIVSPGEVLISGVYGDGDTQPIRFTRAEGAVYARTVEELCVEIPYKYAKKVYTGSRKIEKCVNFFNYNINISKTYSNTYINCDIIKRDNILQTPSGRDLPFGYTQTEYCEYVWEDALRTPEEAERLAHIRLERGILELVGDGQLLSVSTRRVQTSDGLSIICTVTYVGNIAISKPFEVETD